MFRAEERVLGVALPPGLCLAPDGRVNDRVTAFMAEQLRSRINGEAGIACVLCPASSGSKIFLGVPQRGHHPNCSGSGIEVAAGIACTSGFHNFAAAATFTPDLAAERPAFRGVDFDRLAMHFPAELRDMDLVDVRRDAVREFRFTDLCRFPYGGFTRPLVYPQAFAAFEQLVPELCVGLTEQAILENRMPRRIETHIERALRRLISNSTADGRTRPGRKRHAAAVLTLTGRVYYGVNLRSDSEGVDRCSEWTALGAAFAGGDDRSAVAVFIFSPDYGEKGQLSSCGRCLNSLGGCIDPRVGDMIVVYFENAKPTRRFLYTNIPTRSYAAAEGVASA